MDAHDAALLVDLDNRVGSSVDDRCELLSLALERFAQLRPAERDRQLVARELDDAEPVTVERRALVAPEREHAVG